MLREYRPFYGDYVWMLPSGKVDKENIPIDAAQRELREETGYRAENIRHYCTVFGSESINISHHIFIASGLVKDPLPADVDEMIEVHELSIDDAIKNVLSSPNIHEISGFALFHYKHDFL